MKKYFNNKYILFGPIGIAIYLYKINQKPKSKISPPKDTLIFPPKDILMVQRESKQEENDLEDENDEEVMVGQNFIDDVLWNGTKQFASGDKISYVNGKLNGQGSCRTDNGNLIRGHFADDKVWNGTIHFASGEIVVYFNGQVVNN